MNLNVKLKVFFSLLLVGEAFFLPQAMAVERLCDNSSRNYYIQSVEANGEYRGLVSITASTDPLGKNNISRGIYKNKISSTEAAKAEFQLMMTAMNMRYPVRVFCEPGQSSFGAIRIATSSQFLIDYY
jgi:hypothetical protein